MSAILLMEMLVSAHRKPPNEDDEDSVLPPGQRDRSGFWFPLGYSDPRGLVDRRMRRILRESRRGGDAKQGEG